MTENFATLGIGVDASGLLSGIQQVVTQLERLNSTADTAAKKTESLGSAFVETAKKLGELFVVAEVAEHLKEMATQAVETGAELAKLSQRTGESVETLSHLRDAAVVTGTNFGLVQAATDKLARALSDSAAGGTTTAAKAFQLLGISIKDSEGNVKGQAEVMEEVAKKLEGYADGANKTALVMAIFGKGAGDLVPYLKKLAEAEDDGATYSTTFAQEAEKLEESLNSLRLEAEKATVDLLGGSGFVQALVNMVEQFRKGKEIAGSTSEAIRLFGVGLPPMSTFNDMVKVSHDLTEHLKIEQDLAKQKVKMWFQDEAFKKDIDDTQKKLAYVNVMMRQMIERDSASNADANDLRVQNAKHPQRQAPAITAHTAPVEDTFNQQLNVIEKYYDAYKHYSDMEFENEKMNYANEAAYAKFSFDLRLTSYEDYLRAKGAADQASNQADQDAAQNAIVLDEKRLGELQEQTAKNDKQSLQLQAQISAAKVKLTDDQNKYDQAVQKGKDLETQNAQQLKLAQQQEQDRLQKIQQDYTNFLSQLDKENEAQQLQLDLLGQTPEAIARITAEHAKAEELLDKENDLANAWAEAVKNKDVAAADALLAVINKINEAQGKQVAQAGDGAAKIEETTKKLQDQQATWDTLDGMRKQFFSDLFNGGHDAFKKLGESLKNDFINYLYQMTARKWLFQIFADITPGGVSPAMSNNVLGSNGSGNVFSLLGGAANTVNATGGSSGISNFLTGGGSSALTGSGLFGLPSFSASMANLGIAASAGAEAIGGVSTVLSSVAGMAVPVIGWIAAAYAVFSAFSSHDPSPVEAQFGITQGSTGFEDNASTHNNAFGLNLGFRDQGTQQFDGASGNALNTVISGMLDLFAARMSSGQISATSSALEGTQFQHMSGTFTTQDFLSQNGETIMQQVASVAFGQLDPALQSVIDKFHGTTEELMTFVGSLLTFHDLAQKLPHDIASGLEASMDGSEASVERANAIAAAYVTLQDAMNSNPMEDAMNGIADAASGAYGAVMRQGDALTALGAHMDLTAAGAQRLQQATSDYYNSLVQELAQIEQMKSQIDASIQNDITNIRLGGMTSQQQYQYYLNDANQTHQRLLNDTNPDDVARDSARTQQDLNTAYGLLSPDQQNTERQFFINSLTQLDTDTQHLLTVAETNLETAAGTILKQIQDAFGPAVTALSAAALAAPAAAGTMNDAATLMNTAAGNMQRAVDTPLQVVVHTDDGGSLS